MRKRVIGPLRRIAADQYGYFTTKQAKEALGASDQALNSLLRSGTLERVSHGVYRIAEYSESKMGLYLAASLWPASGGVLSYDTALELLELSDVNPSKIHITVPRNFRTRRKIPSSYILHHQDISQGETTQVEGVPVTRAARAIQDCLADHLGSDLLLQAVRDGYRSGHLTRKEAEELQKQIAG